MNWARSTSSSVSSEESPDFESSPEVLTWMRTFRRDCRSSGQFLFSAAASFWDETVWTVWRFGIANTPPCYPCKSTRGRFQEHVQVASFALFDWRVPMKCQCMSSGSWKPGGRGLDFFQTLGQAGTHLSRFLDQLLHIVLAEMAMPCVVTSFDIFSRLEL